MARNIKKPNNNTGIEDSPALSTASEETSGFLSMSQTGRLLSMVDDTSLMSTDEDEDEDGHDDDDGSATPNSSGGEVNDDDSLSPLPPPPAPDGEKSMGSIGDKSQEDSNDDGLSRSKQKMMRALLEEYGIDADLSSHHEISDEDSPTSETKSEIMSEDDDDDDDHVESGDNQEGESLEPSESEIEFMSESDEEYEILEDEVEEVVVDENNDDSDEEWDEEIYEEPLHPSASESSSLPSPQVEYDASARSDDYQDGSSSLSPHQQQQQAPLHTQSSYEQDPFASPMSTEYSEHRRGKLTSQMEQVKAYVDLSSSGRDIEKYNTNSVSSAEKKGGRRKQQSKPPEDTAKRKKGTLNPSKSERQTLPDDNDTEDRAVTETEISKMVSTPAKQEPTAKATAVALKAKTSARKSEPKSLNKKLAAAVSDESSKKMKDAISKAKSMLQLAARNKRDTEPDLSGDEASIDTPSRFAVASSSPSTSQPLEISDGDESSVESPLQEEVPSDLDDPQLDEPTETAESDDDDSGSSDDEPIILIKPRQSPKSPEAETPTQTKKAFKSKKTAKKTVAEAAESEAKAKMGATKGKKKDEGQKSSTVQSDDDSSSSQDSPIVLIKPRESPTPQKAETPTGTAKSSKSKQTAENTRQKAAEPVEKSKTGKEKSGFGSGGNKTGTKGKKKGAKKDPEGIVLNAIGGESDNNYEDDGYLSLNDVSNVGSKQQQGKAKSPSSMKSRKSKSKSKATTNDVATPPPGSQFYELTHERSTGRRSPANAFDRSIGSVDSKGIWRPPRRISALDGSVGDSRSFDGSRASLDSADLNFSNVDEWNGINAPSAHMNRYSHDEPGISPAAHVENKFSHIEFNPVNFGATRSEASSNDFYSTPKDQKKKGIGRFVKWPLSSRKDRKAMKRGPSSGSIESLDIMNHVQAESEPEPSNGRTKNLTRRLSSESIGGLSIRSRSSNGDLEVLLKTPDKPKSIGLFGWPKFSRAPSSGSLDEDVMKSLETGTQSSSNQVGTYAQQQSPVIARRSLQESHPSIPSPGIFRRARVERKDLSSQTTPKPQKPKSGVWLPWAKKSLNPEPPEPSDDHQATRIESSAHKAPSQEKMGRQEPPTPMYGRPSGKLGYSTGDTKTFQSVAEQREARRTQYILDQQRREAIKIQSVMRGYIVRKRHPLPKRRAIPKRTLSKARQKSLIAASQQTPSTVASVSVDSLPVKTDDTQSPTQIAAITGRPSYSLQSHRGYERFDEPKSVAQQREERREKYLLDQKRRGSIVIQSALRGYMVRKELGMDKKRTVKVEKLPSNAPTLSDRGPSSTRPVYREPSHTRPSREDISRPDFPPISPAPAKPKSRMWLPWSKKSNPSLMATRSNASLMGTKSNQSLMGTKSNQSLMASKETNVQRFDTSLYLRKRMYQDEQESETKSLDEIREARRMMYLRDLERRETIKIQAVMRGYLTRKRFSPSPIPTRKKSGGKEPTKSAKNNNSTRMPRAGGQQRKEVLSSTMPETFDRSSYVRARLQREEEERQMKSVADIRLERQQIYVRDLQRREATKIQAAFRGHLSRKRHSRLSRKRQQSTGRSMRGTASTRKIAHASSRKILGQDIAENERPASSWGLVKRLIFGKADENAVKQESSDVEDEQAFEHFDPYADVDNADYFGFVESKYKERTGFFMSSIAKSERHVVDPQSVSDDARHWKGRKRPKSNNLFDKETYVKERQAREEFERHSTTMAQRNAKSRVSAQQDLERRGATKIQAVVRGRIARTRHPMPMKGREKSKHKKSSSKEKKKKKKKSKKEKKKEKSTVKGSADANGPPDMDPKEALTSKKKAVRSLPPMPVEKKQEHVVLRKVPIKKPSIEKTQPPEFTQVNLQKVPPEAEEEVIEIEYESSTEEILEEILEEKILEEILEVVPEEEIAPSSATQNKPKVSVKPESDEAKENVAVVVLDQKQEARLHSGSTYSTDVGDSWWLPSIGTEDTRAYRNEVYVPDARTYTNYPRPAPKNSTTKYWEAVRGTCLPNRLGESEYGQSIDSKFSLLPTVARSSDNRNSKYQPIVASSTVSDDESWVLPAGGSITSRIIPDGNANEQTDDSWVPAPSKPKGRPQRVDFTGGVQKQSSFTWAPHLPSPSKRDKSRVDRIISGDLEAPFSDQPSPSPPNNNESRDLELAVPEAEDPAPTVLQVAPKSRRNNVVIIVFVVILLLLGGGAAAAYFLWDDPPWE